MSALQDFVTTLSGELRTGGGATLDELYNLGEAALEEVESLKADIAVLKLQTPPPVGFKSWEQFDKVTLEAYEGQL